MIKYPHKEAAIVGQWRSAKEAQFAAQYPTLMNQHRVAQIAESARHHLFSHLDDQKHEKILAKIERLGREADESQEAQ